MRSKLYDDFGTLSYWETLKLSFQNRTANKIFARGAMIGALLTIGAIYGLIQLGLVHLS